MSGIVRQIMKIGFPEVIHKQAQRFKKKQMLSAVGQSRLMSTYEQLFGSYHISVAQALLTKNDLSDRAGYLNARNTLLALLELKAVCVVNENDVVAVDEIQEAFDCGTYVMLHGGKNNFCDSKVEFFTDEEVYKLLKELK